MNQDDTDANVVQCWRCLTRILVREGVIIEHEYVEGEFRPVHEMCAEQRVMNGHMPDVTD